MRSVDASRYFQKMRYVAPKYLRKFAFDKMIELDIPESVADFIEGRVPKRIGAKHYMALARQASRFYPRYADPPRVLQFVLLRALSPAMARHRIPNAMSAPTLGIETDSGLTSANTNNPKLAAATDKASMYKANFNQ